jgi:hypothetical protein
VVAALEDEPGTIVTGPRGLAEHALTGGPRPGHVAHSPGRPEALHAAAGRLTC